MATKMTHEISMNLAQGECKTYIRISGNNRLACLKMRTFLYRLDSNLWDLWIDRELNGLVMSLTKFRLILTLRALGRIIRRHKRQNKLRIRYRRFSPE